MAHRGTVVLGKDGKVFVWASDPDDNLTYYHFQDDHKFHHTVSLLQAFPSLLTVNIASAKAVSKKTKTDDLLEVLEAVLQEALGAANVDGSNDEIPPETPVRSHGIISPTAKTQQIQTTLKALLSSDSAYLQFSGQLAFQQEPVLTASLSLHLKAFNEISNCPSIGPGTLLSSFLQIDATAAEAIHLWPPANAAQQYQTGGSTNTNSLFGLLSSSCATSAGKKLLKKWLRQPLVDLSAITARHDAVQYWVDSSIARDAVRLDGLRPFSTDLGKLANTLTTPRDTRPSLVALYELYLVAHQKIPLVVEHLDGAPEGKPSLLQELCVILQECMGHLQPAVQLVEAVLDLDQAPREYLVLAEYQDDLSDVKTELTQCREQIDECHAAMNREWSDWTGASNDPVRLEETNEGGLQFRLPNTNDSKVLSKHSSINIHRILKNGVYFSNKNLVELASERQKLRDDYDRLSEAVVKDAMEVASTHAPVLRRAGEAIEQIDVLVALAHTAAHRQYCRPELSDDENAQLELTGARHACVELQENVEFIPNDCFLGNEEPSFLLVTGPNMGGKSTYLRSLGSIVVLAQIGSFVPCTAAKINICHHILARVGAGDWQERGISTFMAEMLESSRILKTATRRSLILIDELGRGYVAEPFATLSTDIHRNRTSTYDGYGLASAISDHIIEKIGCLCVFTTHFHELTSMKNVKNCHVTAQTSNGVLTFLYSVSPGPCLQSFGIAVAEMANVPSAVIEDAKRRAQKLERFGIIEKFRRLPKETLMQLKDHPDRNKALLQLLGTAQ